MQPLRVVPRPSPEPSRAPNKTALRRATVRAAVLAASAVIFSAAWTGIASEGPPTHATIEAAPTSVGTVSTTATAAAPRTAGPSAHAAGPTRLVQAPARRRKVVVVRRSRAS